MESQLLVDSGSSAPPERWKIPKLIIHQVLAAKVAAQHNDGRAGLELYFFVVFGDREATAVSVPCCLGPCVILERS